MHYVRTLSFVLQQYDGIIHRYKYKCIFSLTTNENKKLNKIQILYSVSSVEI